MSALSPLGPFRSLVKRPACPNHRCGTGIGPLEIPEAQLWIPFQFDLNDTDPASSCFGAADAVVSIGFRLLVKWCGAW